MDDFRLPSRKEMEVLELLIAGGEMYGLQMVKANSALRRGTIYVLLSRMEEKGLVTSRQEKDPEVAGMPRRIYRATGQGERAYAARRQAENALSRVPVPGGATA
jgi:DNA-binding PadR family transcriptional regulator